jgi:hypothetical protein
MNPFIATLSRHLSCAAAASLITVVLGLGFVKSTSVAPVTSFAASPAVVYGHAWLRP